MTSIADNLRLVKDRIAEAALRAGRESSSIRLVAVTKKKPSSLIREAYEAGQAIFGENYAQEMRDKAAELSDLNIKWHFIGHLQKNKAKYVAPCASMVEAVDSLEIAEALSQKIAKIEGSKTLECLIEVNIGDEFSKSGVLPENAGALAREIGCIDNLTLKGLMIIPPYDPDPEKSRPYFRKLRELMEKINSSANLTHPLTELSMGMSHDYEVAIAEGATIVRIGTAIFGER
ncbi:MAG: YggS family pyridoxal phosphate-dependent enzyme [Pseudomonadota bacterium]